VIFMRMKAVITKTRPKDSVNHLINKSELMYEVFRFVYIYDPGGKPSPNYCFFLVPCYIRTEEHKLACRITLHHSNIVTVFSQW
jgi:hypothetical protein